MTANKRTFEVDRFLTRELFLRYPDNSVPPVNQVVVTDGVGGTYFRDISPSTGTTGFNTITLVDTNAVFNADRPFNNLNIKEGPGVNIAKQTINNQDYLTIQSNSVIPSTFAGINTPNGPVFSSSPSTLLNLYGLNGITLTPSTNTSLYIGTRATFGPINLLNSNISSAIQTLNPSLDLSSLTIQAGFGINLQQTGPASYSIGSLASTYGLNSINFLGAGQVNFTKTYNQLNISSSGTTAFTVQNSTVILANYAFSNISLPNGEQLQAQTTNNLLNLHPGYGIVYSTINSSLQIATNAPPSYTYISTFRGTLSAPVNSTNTLLLNNGYGIDFDVNSETSALTIKLASTYVSQVDTECGTVYATNASVLNLRQGKSIVYETYNNMLYINSKDYNRIDIIDEVTGLIRTSLFASLYNKRFALIQGAGMQIIANTSSNQILLRSISSIYVSGPQYAFSYINVYSTASYLGQDLSGFENTQTINSAPYSQAVLNFAGVSPLQMQTDVAKNIIYLGLDQSTLLYSTNIAINYIKDFISTIHYNPSTISIEIKAISTQQADITGLNISSISLNGRILITGNSLNTSFITANTISSVYSQTQISYISTIGTISTPLVVFNYISSQVGINLRNLQPQATLHVGGPVLATNFASYSDSSLKRFKNRYQINSEELEILKPWNFTWKANDTEDVGFAAEDVERILPSAVRTGPNGLKMVDYGRLSVISLSALQDTNNRLKSIESTLKALTDRI